MRYTCGFAFNSDKTMVALVLKNRPDFLAGKFNGIGGKIEKGERSAYLSMAREFKEETGCETISEDWEILGNLFFSGGIVHFFTTTLSDEKFASIKTIEDEAIHKMTLGMAFQQSLDPHARLFLNAATYRDIDIINVTLK